jgi:predicted dehydrogenase
VNQLVALGPLFSLPADLGDYIRSALRDGDALDLIRWGIYGSGYVARRFAADLQRVDGALLAGVSGRNAAMSKDLAKKYEAKFFPDLAALLKSNIQVLYIATPHSNRRAQ